MFGKIRCFCGGLRCFLKHGFWLSHVYQVADLHEGLIWHTDNNWAEVDTFKRNDGTVEVGYIETCKCIYCGKEIKSWYKKHKIHDFYTDEELKELCNGNN